ncbi:hypothetical protein SARC_05710 [Sphaeroforma arctica JP610]|uniref:Mitotic-spindle organizing protein 1 n=1 Tax=Sphaeroforma arctica JP610 TaxID=667725 RepID=A0A0L0FYS4_9EUKA|nr:hypothetical protein SARC_05710 [Sphaeroforma arctica JP610]KNC81997.1 hypothetical protein SARC_05710 [Sphaeroforma arctica JP610]|eukprot:XP_014155899.1 hypothetical protein SARC_05710 [Sphaeroforma arctica JP610]
MTSEETPSTVGDDDEQDSSLSTIGETELKVLMEMSQYLATGLDEETMGLCVRLMRAGCDGETLAQIVKDSQDDK